MSTNTAKDLGKAAFKNGAPCIPALDVTLFADFLVGAQVGDKQASKAMKQWLAGWVEASLATPVIYELTGYDNAYQNPPSYRRVE